MDRWTARRIRDREVKMAGNPTRASAADRRTAKQRLKSPRARLFVALDLPDEVRDRLVAWQRCELADPALRAIEPESLHFTLAFLGYHPEREIERIAQVALDVSTAAPEICLDADPVPRPGPSRPQLFAVEGRSEAAIALQKEMSDRLESARLYKPEKRPFWPHVTVARVRPERRGSRRPARVETPPGPLPDALLERFRAVRVALYRSYLRPQGAEYVSVAQNELPTGGSG
jgi:2'-5' RNA ligase